jgi:hypothetical protein
VNPIRCCILAGLVAGTVDIGAACLINMVGPGPVLRAVASGLLGAGAPREVWVYVLGMILQWAMSIVIAAVFVVAASMIPALLRRWIAAGILYGIIVFVVMTFAVVPLSRARQPHITVSFVVANLAAMIVFGLIVAYIAQRTQRKPLATLA